MNAKLGSALVALSRGNTLAACGLLKAFTYETTAHDGTTLTSGEAAQLLAGAAEIADALGCP